MIGAHKGRGDKVLRLAPKARAFHRQGANERGAQGAAREHGKAAHELARAAAESAGQR